MLADMALSTSRTGGEVARSDFEASASSRQNGPRRDLEVRHGDEIRKQFGFGPDALTAEEARYLIGFRTADELRNRVAAAQSARVERLAAKGVREGSADEGLTRRAINVRGSRLASIG
mgnify:CR=1 FL=1